MEWISVKDRLPGHIPGFIQSDTVIVTNGISVWLDDFWTLTNGRWMSQSDGEITHWQPLPEPPKQ